MALRHLSAPPLFSLAVAANAPMAATPKFLPPLLQRLRQPLPVNPIRVPAAAAAAISGVAGILSDIWEGILRAVPKKKTSHMKKRHRQMAGKALKDVTAMVKCSGCGRVKMAHVLCPYCVTSITSWLNSDAWARFSKKAQKTSDAKLPMKKLSERSGEKDLEAEASNVKVADERASVEKVMDAKLSGVKGSGAEAPAL